LTIHHNLLLDFALLQFGIKVSKAPKLNIQIANKIQLLKFTDNKRTRDDSSLQPFDSWAFVF